MSIALFVNVARPNTPDIRDADSIPAIERHTLMINDVVQIDSAILMK